MSHLKSKYLHVLNDVKLEFTKTRWFYSDEAEHSAIASIDWAASYRHLIGGFAISEALGHDPEEFTDYWVCYLRSRVIPIMKYNSVMEMTDQSIAQFRNSILSETLHNMAAYMCANEQFKRLTKGDEVLVIYSRITRRIIEIVFQEVIYRFDRSILYDPAKMIDKYETRLSPLLRSSMVETHYYALSKMIGVSPGEEAWPELYERSRQLLDDLSDIRFDIARGRLTLPVLVGLLSEGATGALRSSIETAWRRTESGHHHELGDDEWFNIKRRLKDLRAFDDICSRISAWMTEVRMGLLGADLPGDISSILLLVELKRAHLSRLVDLDFDDQEPPFTSTA
jgi:hypothetical protein